MSKLGVLAEDQTDCLTIENIVNRIAPRLNVKKRAAHGCSNLRRKAGAWMRELAAAGCAGVVLVHDLDRDPVTQQLNSQQTLYDALYAEVLPTGIHHLICIPVEEIEAWFWSDPLVVKQVGRGKGKASVSPHSIRKPKEALQRISRDAGNKPLYSTNDNPQLAQILDLGLCASRCPAFAQLSAFVHSVSVSAAPMPTRRGRHSRKGRSK